MPRTNLLDFPGIITLVATTQAYMVLGLHQIYKAVGQEADSQGKKSLDVLKEHFWSIVRYKHITYTAVILFVLSLLLLLVNQLPADWILPLPEPLRYVWIFSYALSGVLIYTLVIFFGLETLYHLTANVRPLALRNNRRFQRLVVAVSLLGAFLISFGLVFGWVVTGLFYPLMGFLDYFMLPAFMGVFFVGGLGSIGIIDLISKNLASYISVEKKKQLTYLFVSIATPLILFLLFGTLLFQESLSANALLPLIIGDAYIGATLALPVGAAYFVHLLRTKHGTLHASRLVYFILLIILSGIFIGYSLNETAGANLNPSILSFSDYAGAFVIPMALFAVGYTDILLTMPRQLERRLHLQEKAVIASLTFFLLFVVIWEYEVSATSSVGAPVFLFLEHSASTDGLLAGAGAAGLLIVVRKNYRKIAHRKIRGDELPLLCSRCGSQTDLGTRFCGRCGNPVSEPLAKIEEGPVFKGEGKLILKGTRHHSAERKAASLLAGGPLGYLFFGKDETRKYETEGELIVTPHFVRCGGKDYPIERIVGVGKSRPAPSVVLALKKGSGVERQLGLGDPETGRTKVEAELRVEDHNALLKSIEPGKVE